MPLVGNDVVDLSVDGAAARWEDERFLGKVFTESEREVVRRAAVPAVVLWSLWACKEAAYKVVRKLNPDAGFVPRRFPVGLLLSKDLSMARGRVKTSFGAIPVRVEAGDGFVHVLARWGGAPSWDGIACRVLEMDLPATCRSPYRSARFASMRIRQVVREHLSERLGCRVDRIQVVRPESNRGLGPPAVQVAGAPVDIDISMSHDGRFLAFALTAR